MTALAVAALVADDDDKRGVLELVDGYMSAAGTEHIHEFDALQALHRAVRRLPLDTSKKQFVAKAIDVRLAEVTAAMAGVSKPVLKSDLLAEDGRRISD